MADTIASHTQGFLNNAGDLLRYTELDNDEKLQALSFLEKFLSEEKQGLLSDNQESKKPDAEISFSNKDDRISAQLIGRLSGKVAEFVTGVDYGFDNLSPTNQKLMQAVQFILSGNDHYSGIVGRISDVTAANIVEKTKGVVTQKFTNEDAGKLVNTLNSITEGEKSAPQVNAPIHGQ